MLGCIPSPKFRVIHRSLLFDAIEEHKQTPPREEQEKETLLRQILDALEAKEEKTQIDEPSKNIVDENKEGKNGNKKGNNDKKNEEQEESSSEEESDSPDARRGYIRKFTSSDTERKVTNFFLFTSISYD